MHIDPTAGASGVVAATAVTAAIVHPAGGSPSLDLIAVALLGACLGVWWDPPHAATGLRWAGAALGRLAVSTALAVAGALSLPAVAAGYVLTQPLSGVHPMIISGLLGLVGHIGLQWLRARVPRPDDDRAPATPSPTE